MHSLSDYAERLTLVSFLVFHFLEIENPMSALSKKMNHMALVQFCAELCSAMQKLQTFYIISQKGELHVSQPWPCH